MTDKILIERDGPVTTIVINRPKSKNALDNEAARGLAAALKAFEADPEARVAVLTGAGGAFCAGADLKELGGGTDYFPWAGSDDGPLRHPLAKPVIAAIEGHACAGGLGVALFCDIRIVDDGASGDAGGWSVTGAMELSTRMNRRDAVRWAKRAIHLPIGERWLIISVVAAVLGAQWALGILLACGLLALVYVLAGRTLRTLTWRVIATTRSISAASIMTGSLSIPARAARNSV